jgi:hypothetical protein
MVGNANKGPVTSKPSTQEKPYAWIVFPGDGIKYLHNLKDPQNPIIPIRDNKTRFT